MSNDAYLAHFGIKGMKWGIRRYQNEDGSLSEAGKRRYGQGNKKLGKFTLPTTTGQMRRDVRKMRRNMVKDTIRGTFSKKSDLRRRDVRPYGPIVGKAIRTADSFSKQGFKDAMSRNKQVASNYKNYMNTTYGDKYRKAKKRQIVKAIGVGTTLAAIGGITIATSAYNNKKEKALSNHFRQNNAHRQYEKQQTVIDRIKSNPNAQHFDDRAAKKIKNAK